MTSGLIDQPVPRAPRLAVLDLARGLAVIAMAIYHFSWDLSWFAFVEWDVAQGSGWRMFAASIAGSFLFLAGISLDLAHHREIRWPAFWRREAIIVLAAASVSAATFLVFGETFVRFGILHSIAAASLIALPFCRLPVIASAIAAVLLLSLPHWAASPVFDGPIWVWTGLGDPGFASVDYVPVAPWAGLALAGVAVSKALRRSKLTQALFVTGFTGRPGRSIRWLGSHSLAIYLLHQPVLYGLVWAAATIVPVGNRTEISFVRTCTQTCTGLLGDTGECQAACRCTLDRMKTDDTWQPLVDDPQNQSLRAQMNTHYAACLVDPSAPLPAD